MPYPASTATGHRAVRALRRLAPLLAAMVLLGGCAAPPEASVPAAGSATATPAKPAWTLLHLGSGERAYDFPVYLSHPLTGDLSRIREVVFIQHGLRRNGDDYFATGAALLAASGRDPAEVLLVAPDFPSAEDSAKGFGATPLWSHQGWMSGEDAVNRAFPLSSLQVLDDLVALVTDRSRLPDVQRVTIAGHSGGGQLVHRYAVLNNVDERVRAQGIDLRYVVANPSSYLYFTSVRPRGKGFGPYDKAKCPGYDQYRYGMQDMVPYARGASGLSLFRRYAQRQVTYLVGGDDNDPNHRVLDKSCGAEAEGPTRLERARGYLRYKRYLASGRGITIRHSAFEVVGVGHNQSHMFGSQCGARALFGTVPSDSGDAAACRAPQL